MATPPNTPLLKNPPRDRIYDHMTKTRFIHFEDSMQIGKIRVFCGEYVKDKGMGKSAFHFIDLDDARVLFNDLSWSKPVKWIDYKGTTNGETVSRVMTVNTKEDPAGTPPAGRGKVWFELKTGPGKATETGAVMPAGEPTTAVSIALTKDEARRLAYAVLAYIAAQETARAVWALYKAEHPEKAK